MRVRVGSETMAETMPNLDEASFAPVDENRLLNAPRPEHRPRILLLYGSVRARSFSRLVTEEAVRILQGLGAETRSFNPSGLPLPDGAEVGHPKVQELRDLVSLSEGMVWCSPERHGAMSAIMKAQIDWIPLALGAVPGVTHENGWVFDGMESGVIQGVSLELGGLHVGEALGGRILDAGRPLLRRQS